MAYAQGAAAAPEAGSMMSFVVPMIFMVVIFYFLLIRPQQKKTKEHKALLDNLKKGDRVITSGGIIGTIINIDDQSSLWKSPTEFASTWAAPTSPGSPPRRVVEPALMHLPRIVPGP